MINKPPDTLDRKIFARFKSHHPRFDYLRDSCGFQFPAHHRSPPLARSSLYSRSAGFRSQVICFKGRVFNFLDLRLRVHYACHLGCFCVDTFLLGAHSCSHRSPATIFELLQ